MSLAGRLKTVIEVKASAAQIHEAFSRRPHMVTTTSPESAQTCELLEGEWGKQGSVISWKLRRNGSNPQSAKELMELTDDENFITIYKSIEGNALEKYKSFYSTAKKSRQRMRVAWCIGLTNK